MSASKEEENFLRWLGGYFDHGGCCKIYHRVHKIRGRSYPYLDVHLVLSGTKESMEYVKAHYHRWNAKLSQTQSKRGTWRFIIRSRTEVLFFCQELLSYSKFRGTELNDMIEAIKKETRL